jgi:hypothetical protein
MTKTQQLGGGYLMLEVWNVLILGILAFRILGIPEDFLPRLDNFGQFRGPLGGALGG